jgi:hypothetical protein
VNTGHVTPVRKAEKIGCRDFSFDESSYEYAKRML